MNLAIVLLFIVPFCAYLYTTAFYSRRRDTKQWYEIVSTYCWGKATTKSIVHVVHTAQVKLAQTGAELLTLVTAPRQETRE